MNTLSRRSLLAAGLPALALTRCATPTTRRAPVTVLGTIHRRLTWTDKPNTPNVVYPSWTVPASRYWHIFRMTVAFLDNAAGPGIDAMVYLEVGPNQDFNQHPESWLWEIPAQTMDPAGTDPKLMFTNDTARILLEPAAILRAHAGTFPAGATICAITIDLLEADHPLEGWL